MRALLTILLLASVVILFTACTKKSPTTEIAVVLDITDDTVQLPSNDELLEQFELEQNKWNGAILHLTTITNVSINQKATVSLAPENEWMGNRLKRNNKVKQFEETAAKKLAITKETKTGKNNSSVYIPVTTQLNQLSQSNSQVKTLILYSDLMENTAELSFYRPEDLNQLKNNPKGIIKRFEMMADLPSLSGIEVYIIYQPKSVKKDDLFRLISGVYKEMLENKGAKVFITANLGN